jgi:hypothetical protein
MGKSGQLSVRIISLILGVFSSNVALAVDLLLFDANAIQVGTCAQQVRFKVKLVKNNNEQGASSVRASYRIGIYSALNKPPLTTFSVSEQKLGDNFNFVVPSDLLSCVHSVTIVVNDNKKFREGNNSNNKLKVTWKDQSKVFGSPCAAQLDNCPR